MKIYLVGGAVRDSLLGIEVLMPRIFQQIADEEMKRARVPICFNIIGLGWAGPLIIDTGTDFEKETYLKGILTGEDIWCQGFSEPNHGSDLGSIQTRAERDGERIR